MTQWREASEQSGFLEPETLINTGNMLARYDGDAEKVVAATTAVLRSFRLGDNVVPIVRAPALLQALLEADPIPEAAASNPNQIAVYFFASPRPDFSWLQAHDGPEQVHVVQNHLVVDFTRVTAGPARLIRQIDKHCGVNTSRNWNSVRRIAKRCTERRAG